ncbi:MAG: leucyl aminopeptidase family protein [Alphaproteobacteria bacterium]|nr:MAG: leucyl aminopeptidase family protein [Alphaproteobacteria bacterium]
MFDATQFLTLDCPDDALHLHLVPEGGLADVPGLGAAGQAWAGRHDFTGKPDSSLLVPTDHGPVALCGVAAAHTPWSLAAAAQNLPAGSYRLEGVTAVDAARLAYGWALAQYRFDRYLSADAPAARLLVLPAGTDMDAILALLSSVALVRDLVNTPAEDMGPAHLQDVAEALAEEFGGSIATIVGDDLLDENFPAIHAVGRAAAEGREPRLIDLQWGDEAAPRLTLVGKGVCFDSGGLDIKPASGMLIMKKDMGGAAHALGLARLIMATGLKVRLRVLIPAVENAIDGNAYRPGDVLATRAGLSVEIGNTDAEGRVVLCDALALASEENPALLVDFATLTGAARVALGPDLPATFANDDGLWDAFEAAARTAQDPIWRMPLWAPYADDLKSPIADMNNTAEGGFAGSITAALYLQKFVGAGIPWVHFDVFAWTPKPKPGRPKGGEAQGLRTSFAAIKSFLSLDG